MNLGVETFKRNSAMPLAHVVSAFSDESWGGDHDHDAARSGGRVVSAFSDESWGGDPLHPQACCSMLLWFQHSLMNLGVETNYRRYQIVTAVKFQHSLMNLGVETVQETSVTRLSLGFQHSLMNLGVETFGVEAIQVTLVPVSAFSDESWGGDQNSKRPRRN